MTKVRSEATGEVLHPLHSYSRPFGDRAPGLARWRRPSALSKLSQKSAESPEYGMDTRRRPFHSTRSQQSLTIVVISDTHELHREVDIPAGDLLVHCGDLSMLLV